MSAERVSTPLRDRYTGLPSPLTDARREHEPQALDVGRSARDAEPSGIRSAIPSLHLRPCLYADHRGTAQTSEGDTDAHGPSAEDRRPREAATA